MSDLPAPLVPSDCDLTCYEWFTLWHRRLKQSEWWLSASDLARSRNVDLWCEAMDQIPAASLPDSDVVLARFAGFGRDVGSFRLVKDEIMEPWVLCADGRYYHPTLAEAALKSWAERRLHTWKRECDRIRKENFKREKEKLPPLEFPPMPAELAAFSGGKKKCSVGKSPNSDGTRDPDPGNPPENALTRQDGTGQDGTSKNLSDANASSSADADAAAANQLVLTAEPEQKPSDVQAAFEAWNTMAARCGLPQAEALSAKRAAAIKARLAKGGGLTGWARALEAVEASPHCLGENDRGWRASIDFVASEAGFLKLREGNYANSGRRLVEQRDSYGGGQRGRSAMQIALEGMERDENGDLLR